MKRYHLYVYDKNYPFGGGSGDFNNSFETIEEIIKNKLIIKTEYLRYEILKKDKPDFTARYVHYDFVELYDSVSKKYIDLETILK